MGWVKMKLGDVIKNREGRYKPNDPTIAGLKRIDKINFSGQIFLSDKGSNTDMILIKKGDLVISGINVEKGALAVYEGEEDILATIHYSSYIFDTTKIDIDFLKVFLRSPDFIQLLKEQVPGGIKTEIKPKHILPLEVYFPETTKEQKAIALHFFEKEAKFNQLNEHISYQLTQLENLNQAILQEAVQGKLVKQDTKDEPASELLKRIKAEKATLRQAQGKGKKEKPLPPIKPEEIPFEIPENWVWCRLGEIADIKRGKGPKYSDLGVFKMLNQKCIRWFDVDLQYCKAIDSDWFQAIPNEFKVQVNDVLVNSTGDGTIGRSAIAHNKVDGYVFDSHILKVSSTINQLFICYFINSRYGQEQVENSKGAKSTKQHELGVNNLSNFVFPLPPLSEQKRIVAEIEKQFAKTKQLKEHIIANQQATEQLLKALLRQAFEVKENLWGHEQVVNQTATVNWDSLAAEPFIKFSSNTTNTINNIDLELAIMIQCTENKLGVTYGEVGVQKNVFNTSVLQKNSFSKNYSFENYHYGTYSLELKNDLNNNPYLTKTSVKDKGEVYKVHPKYKKQILDLITSTENKRFIQSLNAVLSIYDHPIINKETDNIELFNTILKCSLDNKSSDLNVIYNAMKQWPVRQSNFKTKAEKFSISLTDKMLQFMKEFKIIS